MIIFTAPYSFLHLPACVVTTETNLRRGDGVLFGIKTEVDGQQPFSGEVVGTDDWFSTTNSGTTYRLTQSQPNEAILVVDVMCWGYVF